MTVAELWRYPVKSLGGERLGVAELSDNGIGGDRVVHVRDGRGRVITARTRPHLLGLRGTLGPDGEPLVGGRPWTSAEVAASVRAAAGPDVELVRYDGRDRSTSCRSWSPPTAPSPDSGWTTGGSDPISSSPGWKTWLSAPGPVAGSASGKLSSGWPSSARVV